VNPTSPAELIRARRILVCVGTGGVGKTTVAAAIGLEAARAGQRALVLTIDPARRLANALGLSDLGNEPQEVGAEAFGDEKPAGRLHAMMLDTKHTFDGLIQRFAEDPAVRDRILENPIYQNLSDALAGSGEYAAMEKVLEMSERDEFDVIVVDTPPAQHALDFLDAPQRLAEFFESRLVQLLVHPAMAAGRLGVRLFQRPIHKALQLLEKVTGVDFLEDLSDFLLAIESLSTGFVERSVRIREELVGPRSAFLLIAGPGRQRARNTETFLRHLEEMRVRPAGLILNRAHFWPGGGEPPRNLPDDASELVEDDFTEDVTRLATELIRPGEDLDSCAAAVRSALLAAAEHAIRVRGDEESAVRLRSRVEARGGFFRAIPELNGDVHDLDGLDHVAGQLFRDVEPAQT